MVRAPGTFDSPVATVIYTPLRAFSHSSYDVPEPACPEFGDTRGNGKFLGLTTVICNERFVRVYRRLRPVVVLFPICFKYSTARPLLKPLAIRRRYLLTNTATANSRPRCLGSRCAFSIHPRLDHGPVRSEKRAINIFANRRDFVGCCPVLETPSADGEVAKTTGRLSRKKIENEL